MPDITFIAIWLENLDKIKQICFLETLATLNWDWWIRYQQNKVTIIRNWKMKMTGTKLDRHNKGTDRQDEDD